MFTDDLGSGDLDTSRDSGRDGRLGLRPASRIRAGVVGLALMVAVSGCGSGEQDSPESVVEAAYAAISEGKFADACEYVDEQAKDAIGRFGATCETAMAKEYPAEKRRAMKDVDVDSDALDMSADVVTVPETAVTFDGKASADGDTTVIERDGKWWITFGQ